jgi:serine protease
MTITKALRLGCAAGLALSTALAATDVRGVIPVRAADIYLFNNFNAYGVLNGPPANPTTFVLQQNAQVDQLATYHWNNGAGSPPGSIGLEQTGVPQSLRWFPAVGSAGQGGVPSAAWIATVNVQLTAGVSYTVLDSNPATWSQNAQSGSQGFARVFGYYVAPPPLPYTPSPPIPGPLLPHGGPIAAHPKVYVTYWGWSSDPAGEAPYLERFLSGVGGSAWLNTVTQYHGTYNTPITNAPGQFKGSWYDNVHPAPAQPTEAQIAQEAANAAWHFGYDPDAIYFIATAHGQSAAGFPGSFCASHSVAFFPLGPVAYVDFPYIPDANFPHIIDNGCGANDVNAGAAGMLDGVSILAGHEYTEALTDKWVTAWYDSSGSVQGEIGDKCKWWNLHDIYLPTGTFAVQPLWSNAANGCMG